MDLTTVRSSLKSSVIAGGNDAAVFDNKSRHLARYTLGLALKFGQDSYEKPFIHFLVPL
jgi:hypothetical protein